MAGEADLGSARGKIVIGSDLQGITTSAQALAGFEKQTQSVGQGLQKLTMVATGLGLALAGAVALSARSFVGFETQMLGVKAVAGATEEQFQQLNDLAIKLGQDTVFSAKEAAAALEELAKAGVSVENILNGAADGAVALAGAAGIGIPEAAALIASALNQFELSGTEASNVADVFANIANKSAADATSFGEALKYVATRAHGLGIPLAETAAAIAVMADAGIDGSSAGTALNAMLGNLVAPTKEQALLFKAMGLEVEDIEGNFIGLTSIIEQLRQKTEGLGDVAKQELLTQLFDERGARAANALLNTTTESAKKGGKAYTDYVDAMSETGSAAENMEIRMSGVQGSIEALKGSVETAQIELGKNFAPAIKASADALTGFVNTFSSLPNGAKQAIAAVTALSAGLLLLGVGGVKAVTFAKNMKGAFDAVANSMGKANLTGRQFATGLGIGAAAVVATIAIAKMVQEAGILDDALKALNTTYKDVFALREEFILQGMDVAADDAQALGKAINTVELDIIRLTHTVHQEQTFDIFGGVIPNLNAFGDAVPFVTGNLEELGKKTDEVDVLLQEAKTILSDPNIDTTGFVTAIREVIHTFDTDPTKNIDSLISLISGLEDVIEHKSKYANTTDDVTTAVEAQAEADALAVEQLLAQTAATEEADAAAEKFSQSIAEIAVNSLLAQGAIRDIAPGLDGIQTGFADAGATIEDIVVAMDKFGDIKLTKANREALEYSNILGETEQNLEGVSQAISNNEEDMSMWQGRIGLVTSVLGGNTEVLGEWIEKLNNGTITQEEFNAAIASGVLGPLEKLEAAYTSGAIGLDKYNQAKAAALFLITRSAGGIQDENVELIDNVIQLAAYVKEHDNAAAAVNRLTDAQKGFLEATKSEVGREFLQTLELFQSIGAAPDAIAKFILDSSASDPVIAALVESLGLVEGDHDINLTWNNANATLDDLGGAAEFLVSLDNKTVEVHVDTEAQALQVAKENAEALDGKEVIFVIHGDDEPYTRTLDQLETPLPVVIPITTEVLDPMLTGLDINAPAVDIPAPEPVPITAIDATAEGVDAAKANIATIPDAATTAGSETGSAYATGLSSASPEVTKALTDLGSMIYTGLGQIRDNVGVYGTNAGQNFAVAFINAIAGYNALALNQGFTLAYNALQGAKQALGISSPSTEAIELARNFSGTFTKTVVDQKQEAREAGWALMDALTSSMGGNASKWSLLQGPGAAGTVGQITSDARSDSPAQGAAWQINAPITVAGVSDPEEAADLVVTKLFNTVTRLDVAGALER